MEGIIAILPLLTILIMIIGGTPLALFIAYKIIIRIEDKEKANRYIKEHTSKKKETNTDV